MALDIVSFLDDKRLGKEHDEQSIADFVKGVVDKTIPDYQITAWLMAVAINGLSYQEITWLTLHMAKSGDYMIPLPKTSSKDIFIDKHSSGGIGDKTTLILLPICVAAGLKVAKLSGRGLGFTGGTIDKLNSVGVKTDISLEDAFKFVDKTGIFVIQSGDNIAPADKVLYQLRDVTSTVQSIPLISSSIMSKKLALKVDYLFLDVKYGSGAFAKDLDYAMKLSKVMYGIGKLADKRVEIHISSMQQPLGYCIGNAIEVLEAYEFITGESMAPDLKEFIYFFAADILVETGIYHNKEAATKAVKELIANQDVLAVVEKWFAAQGADVEAYKSKKYFNPKYQEDVKSTKEGFLSFKSNEEFGWISNDVGAGRKQVDDVIDMHAGIRLHKKLNDKVREGDILFTVYSSKPIDSSISKRLLDNCQFTKEPVELDKLIIHYRDK